MPRRLLVLFGLSLVGQSVRAQQTAPVILTLSGGVSLGTYEAGVNWGLVEVMKRTANDSLRGAWSLPRYHLAAAAGASAGNINGFLAAIEWCRTADPVPPEQSLFWKIWVRTGFDQLFPLERYDQADTTSALFSRRYFHAVLFDTIAAAMHGAPPSPSRSGCAVPVGVTVTRMAPDTIAISRGIRALTQRYAATVTVTRRGDSLLFIAPPSDVRDNGKLGALILLPDCHGVVDTAHVFRLTEASSAFPGAFSPISLKYQDRPGAACDAEPEDSTLFSDGGLFDNNPIDLAAGLYDETIWKHPDRADSNAIMVFIDPDAVRGRLAQVQAVKHDSSPPPATGGIAALLDLFAGAVPAARQYEAQSFARLLARAPHVFVRNNIKITNRRFAIVGHQLGNFAAFLGKPFREYDFYVGVYDALSFFASEACAASRTADSTCVARRLRTLLETRDINFGADSLPRAILRLLYAAEYPGAAAEPAATVERPSPRATLLLGLVQANLPLAESTFDNGQCASADAVVSMLCHDGFGAMLDHFASDPVLEVLDRLPQTGCLPKDWRDSPVRCEGDQDFVDFVRRPDHFLAAKLGLMLHQLWKVEQRRKQAGEKGWTGVAAISEIVFQSGTAFRYRRRFDLNASSVPRGSGRSWLADLVPNYVSINLGGQGLELGYRPTWHVSNSIAFGATGVPLHLVQTTASDVNRYFWVAGLNLHSKQTGPVLTGIETGIEMFGRWKHDGGSAGRAWAIPMTFYLLAGKLRVGARFFPENTTAVNDGTRFALSVGLSDLNGLIYWMFRKS